LELALDQASGNDVAALTSIPLMNTAAMNVDTVRKASAVISFLLVEQRPIALRSGP
jgi:hypothetical protein